MRNHRGVRMFQCADPGSGTVKAAIAILNPDLAVTQYPELTTNNIVVVRIQTGAWDLTLCSFYFEPDQPIGPYLAQLKKIAQKLDTRRWIIGGDTNAKNTWWGSPVIDHRGEEMADTLYEMDLNILNAGRIPTFDTYRGGRRFCSFVDITACSTNILDLVDGWKVDQGLTSSDHNGIIFEVKLQRSKSIKIQRTTRVYNTKKANWLEFSKKIQENTAEKNITVEDINRITDKTNLENTIKTYSKLIEDACSESIPKKTNKETFTLPWWSKDLVRLKKEVATKKRRVNCAALIRRPKVVADYLQHKESYENEAARVQINSWKEFCGGQDRETMWEGIYRVIGRTKNREEDLPLKKEGKMLDEENSARLLAETFYPEDLDTNDSLEHRRVRELAELINLNDQHGKCDPVFTHTELAMAINSFNPKKAPGGDGFTLDICQHAIGSTPGLFLELINKCFALHLFPNIWKEAVVVVLRKPGKDSYTAPKSYRPIGLLPILGKIYEKMLVTRLKYHLLPRVSTRQFGFMPQRSTEDSLYTLIQHVRAKIAEKKIVTLISLDIEGAFDSAWWPKIRVRLAEEKCPINLRRVLDSYLEDRRVKVKYAGFEIERTTSKGCVQGSIGGPILWNLLLDPLLKSLEAKQIYTQAFADDIVMVFDGRTAHDIELQANAALEHVRGWGAENKLRFAPHKTMAMILTKKLNFDTPHLRMGETDIKMTQEIKLLGIIIDSKLTFNSHVAAVCRKAIGIHKQLCRAAKVSWGLHPEVIRTIYMACVEPIVLYAASVWAPAVEKIGVRRHLATVQRGIALKMCKAYRTVSLNSALLLAGILPLDLRVREAASLYVARVGVPQPALGDREIERMAKFTENPHPANQLSLSFLGLVDEEQVAANSHHEVRIFTDGSKIKGKVGAALSFWNSETEIKTIKLSLPSYCTVYQAELLAIWKASEEMIKHQAVTFALYSDSMSALQTVTNLSSLHPLAVDTRKNLSALKTQNKIATLFWIKAHAGLEGNERADSLAKAAALTLKKKPDYDLCPVSFIKRGIRLETLDIWNQRYVEGETGAVTKIFFPDARMAFSTIRKFTPSNLTTQIMTGHGGFSEYLNRFKCKENASCLCEPGTSETVPHILFNCPITATDRFNIEQKLSLKLVPENIPGIMIGPDRDEFLQYCIKVVNPVISRNNTRQSAVQT